MAAQLTCPHCRQVLTFEGPVPAGVKIRCAACGRPFVNAGRTAAVRADVPVAAPFAPPPAASLPVAPVVLGDRPRRGNWTVALGAAAGLLVTAGVLVAVFAFPPATEPPPPGGDNVAQVPEKKVDPPKGPPETVSPPAESPKPAPQVPTKKKTPATPPQPPAANPPPPKEWTVAGVEPELQKQINRSIERGVAYLLSPESRRESRFAQPGFHPLGYAALRGLTLLECDRPKGDPDLARTAEEVRAGAGKAEQTYIVALAILFLDKFGDAGDEKLIQRLALRLAAVQSSAGGWGYGCPPVPDESFADALLDFLRQERAHRLASKGDPAVAAQAPTVPERFRSLALFAPLDAAPPVRVPGVGPRDARFSPDDNSNTQFALLALWVARRHGVPLERCFSRAERRFRQTQNPDGGWFYKRAPIGLAPSTNSMTCVGLLGLAIGRGSEYELLHLDKAASGTAVQKLGAEDPSIQKGLKRLGSALGVPTGRTTGLPLENLYYLWSVERVAVLYGLPTIGDKDWYRWGVEILLANQRTDGAWLERNSHLTDASIDTCFALLFLKRADLAPDLARNLRLYVPVVDPDRRGGGNR